MGTKFRDILESMPAERKQRIADRTAELLAELPLQELRKARELSQEELAESLGVNQATVSKLERRTDMYISTMRRFVGAMGRDLQITARFPDGSVRIDQFAQLARGGGSTTPSPRGADEMAHGKKTGQKAASRASKTLRSGSTAKASKSAAGSALSQTKTSKTTSSKAAGAASKTLRDGRTSKVSKSAAGSTLSQKHSGRKKKK
jgi:transcriptional regulator with XRE-family HTH domain